MVACFLLLSAVLVRADPGPGDVFKEFSWNRANPLLVFGPDATSPKAPKKPKPARATIMLDLEGATRAEVMVRHWSGHEGTSGKSIRFNDGAWIELPLPKNTPTHPECYFAKLNRPVVEVPLKDLKSGTNEFTFTCGPQICHNFDYPAFSISWVIVRVYYSGAKPHAEARIVSPKPGAALGDQPVFEAEAVSAPDSVRRVEFIAEYEGFPWGGDGVFRQWHYDYDHEKFEHHAGTATNAPWRATWDTKWIADQRQPMRLIARVTDTNGIISMTRVVDGLTFQRDRSVKFYPASGVKQYFNSQYGKKSVCTINWIQGLNKATTAHLILATHGPQEEVGEFGLNDHKLGTVAAQAKGRGSKTYYAVDVPLDALKSGENEFYILSETKGHALEGSWPGPSLFLEIKP